MNGFKRDSFFFRGEGDMEIGIDQREGEKWSILLDCQIKCLSINRSLKILSLFSFMFATELETLLHVWSMDFF